MNDHRTKFYNQSYLEWSDIPIQPKDEASFRKDNSFHLKCVTPRNI